MTPQQSLPNQSFHDVQNVWQNSAYVLEITGHWFSIYSVGMEKNVESLVLCRGCYKRPPDINEEIVVVYLGLSRVGEEVEHSQYILWLYIV